jgi:3-hydroxyisobutyrate dehydrogenase-like beta-hydroxyacid dehydrogenase
MKIAFLGLGRMGSGMAQCLAKAHGQQLTVWNRTPDQALPLREWDVVVATDPSQAVADAQLVFSCLFDDRSVEELFNAEGPVLGAMRSGATHICMATISPDCANRLQALHAAHGTRYLSGPVVGRPDQALAGQLVQFLAGDAEAATDVEAICRAFAAQVVRLPGPAGAANAQKLCVNFFIAALIETMAECYTLGDKLGAQRHLLAMFFEQSLALRGLKGYAERMFKQEVDAGAGFTMTAGRKDLALMLDAAARVGCPLDIGHIIADKMDQSIAQGNAGVDWSAIQDVTRERAGLPNRG